MLFINNKKLNEKEFVSEVERLSQKTIDLKSLKANPSFTYNEVVNSYNLATFRRSGVKVPKISQGSDTLSVFRFYSELIGEDVEIRYANKSPYVNPLNPGVLIYSPKNLDLPSGEFGFLPSEIDQALFLLIKPECLESPFRKEGSAYRYSHNNLKAASTKKGSKADKISKALKHADSLLEEDLKLFAKGLNISLNEKMDSEDVRNEIKDFAINNIDQYSKAMQSESVRFLGLIQDAIDSGYIISKRIVDNIVWFYDIGVNKGSQITSVPPEAQNPLDYLKTYLGNNMGSHYESLINLRREALSGLKMEEFLQAKKNGVSEEVYTFSGREMTLADVTTPATAKEYLTLSHPEGKQPAPVKCSEFLKGVLAGEITEENISEHAPNYIAKVG